MITLIIIYEKNYDKNKNKLTALNPLLLSKRPEFSLKEINKFQRGKENISSWYNKVKVRRNIFALLLNLYSSEKASGGREFHSLVVRE